MENVNQGAKSKWSPAQMGGPTGSRLHLHAVVVVVVEEIPIGRRRRSWMRNLSCATGGGGRRCSKKRRADELAPELQIDFAAAGSSGRRDGWERSRHRRQDARQRRKRVPPDDVKDTTAGRRHGVQARRGLLLVVVQLEREVWQGRRGRQEWERLERVLMTPCRRLREGGRWCAGEALHDGHELAGFGVHHLGRGGVDDDRHPRLPDVVRIPADPERRGTRSLQRRGGGGGDRGGRRRLRHVVSAY
jgi:hypothetical protein